MTTPVTGYSRNFDLREALSDAVTKLPHVNPDVTRHIKVVSISARIGGNMANTGLYVTVEEAHS